MNDGKRIVGVFYYDGNRRSEETVRAILAGEYCCKVEFSVSRFPGDVSLPDHMDFAVSVGGDGTFLTTAQFVAPMRVPMYGVNTGRLGFLTPGKPERAVDDVDRILAGEATVAVSSVLKGSVERSGEPAGRMRCINEIAIMHRDPSVSIELDVRVDGEDVYRVVADGLIASTPTGSTAYALSTGGPIVHPDLQCMTISLICPHLLAVRPILLPYSAALEVELVSGDSAIMCGDGQIDLPIERGDVVSITRDPKSVLRSISLEGASIFAALRSKFSWGSSGGRERVER